MAPVQWILDLEAHDGYGTLLSDAGSLAVAAYLLARATCQTRSLPADVPTRFELGAAAACIARRAGLQEAVPTVSMLVLDCEAAGLPVL